MTVNVRIPGVGVVSADNAATETTLRQLVQAIGQQQNRARRADSEIASASKQQAGYADRAADSLGQVAASAKSSESAARNLFSGLSENINKASLAGSDLKDSGAATYLKQLGATAVEVSALWAKNFGDLPTNPVKQATGLLNTGVDAVVKGLGGFGKAILPMVPDKLIGAAEGLIGAGLKVTVGMLSDEVNKTIKSYSTFNKMGASFADGMTGMRGLAYKAGLTVDQFSNSMEKSMPSLKALGLNTAGAVDQVARVAYEFDATGKSGRSLRKEMLGLGYSAEEQTELAAQYMAQIRATMTQEKFDNLDKRKLAEGTRQYAEDLKVLRDITGQDAKAAKERARVEVQRAGLLNKLGPEQKQAFEDSFGVMNKLPANIQNALINRIMGQPITDPTIAMSEELMGMIENISQGILSGQKGMQKATMEEIATTQQRVKDLASAGQGMYAISDQLSALNVGGITSDFAKTVNAFILDPIKRDQIQKSYDAAAKGAKGADELSEGIQNFQHDIQKYAADMSNALSPYLTLFTKSLTDMTNAVNDFVFATTKLITGRSGPKGKPPDKDYGTEEYKNDLAAMYVKYIEPLITRLDKLIPELPRRGHARGGIASGPASGYLDLLHGTEAIIPLPDGKNIPVQLSGVPAVADLANTVQQMQASFSAVAAAKNNQPPAKADIPAKEHIQELPTAFSTALETVLSSPAGLIQTMSQVKNQIADDNKMQMAMMQQQIDNLTKLVDAMNDNLRVNERIANELA